MTEDLRGRLEGNGAKQLAELLECVLEEPSRRRAFRKDYAAAADAAGVDISAIPESVLKTLADLSGSELRLLAEINHQLVESGLGIDFPDEDRPEQQSGSPQAVAESIAHPVRSLGVL